MCDVPIFPSARGATFVFTYTQLRLRTVYIVLWGEDIVIVTGATTICTHVSAGLGRDTRSVLTRLNVAPSDTVRVLCHRVILAQKLPLSLRLPPTTPATINNVDHARLSARLRGKITSLRGNGDFSTSRISTTLCRRFKV